MKINQKMKTILPLAAAMGSLALATTPANAALWTPGDMTTDMWFDAADASTITDSAGSVSQWGDKSGNGNHLTQGDGAFQPTTGANTIGGLNAINAAGDWMKANRGAGAYTGQQTAVFEVLDMTQLGASVTVYGSDTGGQDYNQVAHAMFDYQGTTGYRGGTPSGPKSVISPTVATPYVFSSVYDGTNHISYKDGIAGTTVASAGNFAWDELYINSRINDGVATPLTGKKYGEIIVVVGGVTDSERETIEGYLAWKWGLEDSLDAVHTYKNAAPTVVPEPTTTALLGLGGLALILRRRK
jgi:hypothetical protein